MESCQGVRGRSLLRATAGILFATLFLGGRTGAQLGHIVKAQKISSSSGGFTAQLDEIDQFGRSIVNLGDLDGDGVTDLLVGAHTDDDGGVDKGSVYVLFMQANGFVKAWQKISDLAGNFPDQLDRDDQFGRAAASLGDLDGDGVVDVAVSSNYDDDGGTNKGAVYVLFLNTDGTVKHFQKISSTQGGLNANLSIHDEFGRSITALGDLDGDGTTELLVGTPEDDEGGTNTGALHVLFLNTNGTVKNYRRISKFSSGLAIKPGDWFGFCSANLGDFDGDGVVDVAVGAVLDDDGGVNQGSLWILCLNADGSVKSSHEIDELEGNFTQLDDIDQFGTSVVSLGDLDGDGVTDVAVGTVKDDDGGPEGDPDADVGAVYVLFLKPDFTVKSWVKLSDLGGGLPYPLDQYDWFGSALAPLGGSAGDGLFNVAIGCRNDDGPNGSNQGAIYLVQLNDGSAPVASFDANRTLGVAPMTVNFSDTSTGTITAWVWNLGDGPQTTQENPTRTYAAPGTYDVQLTTRGPTGVDSEVKRGFVTVVVGPLAGFDASPRLGPCPLTVAFADQSEGSVTTWSWDFGDGTTSNQRAPVHTYADCGSYTVTQTVTGPTGTHTHVEPGFVVAAQNAPTAAFTRSPTNGQAPLAVQFGDLSTGQVTAWSWDFGDGTGSSEQNPTHVYAAQGSFTVTLTASGPAGSDAEVLPGAVVATVPPPVTYFDATPTLGPAPLTVAFTDLTTGTASAWSWDFGDGTSASERNPVHVYSAVGLFDVTLTATGPGGSNARSRLDLITVEPPPPVAAFVAAPTSGAAPLAVQFTDQSGPNVTSWSWDFGDGASASVASPAHVYAAPGTYTVTLNVSGPDGSDGETKAGFITVSASAPVADFGASPTSGVTPLGVQFTDASTGTVSSRAWSFGDGGSSTATSPAHVYTTPGTYTVTLIAAGPGGVDVEAKSGFITVLPPAPIADFSASPTTGAAPLGVQFTDASTGNVSSRAWSFGDGASSNATSPAHVYATPGSYTVTLTAAGPGGSDGETKVGYVNVLVPPPVADFAANPTSGVAPLTVQFTNTSAGSVQSWAWSFGDGASSSSASPAHVYTTPGTYTVTLTATGPGGSDGETKVGFVTVQFPAPVADFGASPTSGVAPLTVQFTNTTSGNAQSWAWNFGDGASASSASPAHVYATPGTYTVTLTATGPGGSDGETKVGFVTVQFPAPVADFGASPTSGVAPLTVQFTNTTSGNAQSWAWDFGDGASAISASPSHAYTTPGTYTVTLTATGPGGSDGETKVGLVSVQTPAPVADFDATPRDGFAPLQVAFTDTSTGACTAWAWSFGDGSTSILPSPTHLFVEPGSYAVLLAVTGPGGTSTRRRTLVVRPAVLFGDGSFEADVAGLAPQTPWNVYNGSSVLVRSDKGGADHGFPSAGRNWCDIGAEGTSHARPPSNPRGAGSAPTGTAGIQQDFQFPADPHFFFEAAFLLNGPQDSASKNDFMSVDVTDGVTTWNLFYADSFSEFTQVASNGLAMTALEPVHVDLARLFPSASAATVLSLRASVGNVGGSGFPSRGYVDAFRFALSAKATFRNGSGINPAFYGSSPPILGGTWGIEIDSSALPGAHQVLIVARERALGGPRLLGGEALIGGASLFTLAFPCSGGRERFEVPIPPNAALLGRVLATQAVLTGNGTRLGNAFDLVLGY